MRSAQRTPDPASQNVAGGINVKNAPESLHLLANNPVNQVHHHALASNPDCAHFAIGIENSAPVSVLRGQRCMMDFCFV